MQLPSTLQLQQMFAPIFELIDAAGEEVIIKESRGVGDLFPHPPLKGKPMPMRPEDIVAGGIAKEGDFFIVVRADKFPVARRLEQKDRVRFDGRDYAVINDDHNQYRIGGVTYARKLHLRG
jgi:hypothetical protein